MPEDFNLSSTDTIIRLARSERAIEPVGIAQATGKLVQPVAILDQRQVLLMPGLVALQEPGGFAFKDRRLNRVERGKLPCNLSCSK
jgi:hypothetical protein